jgi:hypothetical protein
MAQINAIHLGELRTRRGQNKLQLGLEQSIVNTQSNYYKTCFMAQSSSASPTAAGIQNIEHITVRVIFLMNCSIPHTSDILANDMEQLRNIFNKS